MSTPEKRRGGPHSPRTAHHTADTNETQHDESSALARQDPVTLGVALVQLGERDPDHPLIIAIRCAVEVIDLRRQWRRALREASHDVAGATDWRRVALDHVPHTELQRRRAQPGPLTRNRRGAA